MSTDIPNDFNGIDPSQTAGNTNAPLDVLSTRIRETIESGEPLYKFIDSALKGEGVSLSEQATIFTVAVEAQRRYIIGDLAETLEGESIPRVEGLREYDSDLTDRDADAVMEASDHWRALVGRLSDGANPDNISSALYHGQNDFEESMRPVESRVIRLGAEAHERTDEGTSMLRILANRTEGAAVLDAKAKLGKEIVTKQSDSSEGDALPDLSEYVSLSIVSNVLEQAKGADVAEVKVLLENLLHGGLVDFQHIDAQVRDLRGRIDITLDGFAQTVNEFGRYFRERISGVMPETAGYLKDADQAIRANPDGANDDIDEILRATRERNRAISDMAGTLEQVKKQLTDDLDKLREAA